MLQIARDLTRYNHHGAPCTALANRVARTAASVIAPIFGAACLTILCLTVLAPLFGPLVFLARPESRDIVVFGSIALKEALNEANDYFLSENGTRAVSTYGASTALAKQIEGGMPGDLFFAGDVASMDYLAERNLIKPGRRKDLLRNRLVLIAPANSMLAVTVGPNFPLADAIGTASLRLPIRSRNSELSRSQVIHARTQCWCRNHSEISGLPVSSPSPASMFRSNHPRLLSADELQKVRS
jgi:hypothetical protein